MKPPSIASRFLSLLEEAGENGVTTSEAIDKLGCNVLSFDQARYRMRCKGIQLFTAFAGNLGGGVYFLKKEWRDAIKAVQAAQAKANERQRWLKRAEAKKEWNRQDRAKKREIRLREKAAIEANKIAAGFRKKPKQENLSDKQIAKDAIFEKPAKFAAAAKNPKFAKKVDNRPIDYSRAVITTSTFTDNRWQVTGPVPCVVDSRECRPWAMAAARSIEGQAGRP